MLQYSVKGSAMEPYRVTFEGEGETLAAFCTCPAGRKKQAFCKHVAALLKGDTSNLTMPSDDVTEIARRAEGSPLLEKAKNHIPSKQKIQPLENVDTIHDIANLIAPMLSNTGFWSEYSTAEDGSEFLTVYMRKVYKNGNPYKNPTKLVSVSYQPIKYVSVYDEETGEMHEKADGNRALPYLVDSTNYGTIGAAGASFMKKLDIIKEA